MSIDEYFGEWMKCIDKNLLLNTIKQINRSTCTPKPKDWFRAFELCTYSNLKIVFLGYDPYPQKNIATGILFGNNKEVSEENLSPSLNIVKEAVINFDIPHNSVIFDQTLESWAKQGILMINSALTTEIGRTGAHTMLWRPFMTDFIKRLGEYQTGIIYVLFGEQAKTFKPYIGKYNIILEEKHPAYYARTNKRMPNKIFNEIKELIKFKYNEKIYFYEEVLS